MASGRLESHLTLGPPISRLVHLPPVFTKDSKSCSPVSQLSHNENQYITSGNEMSNGMALATGMSQSHRRICLSAQEHPEFCPKVSQSRIIRDIYDRCTNLRFTHVKLYPESATPSVRHI
jgi:hypothetical protein